MQRCRTTGSRGRRDRDTRPGVSPGSGDQMRPGTLGVARAKNPMKKKKKERRKKDLGSVVCIFYPGRAKHGTTTGPGHHPGRKHDVPPRKCARRLPQDVMKGGGTTLQEWRTIQFENRPKYIILGVSA